MPTRTGAFPIGFRRGWSDWQKDLIGLARWAKENNFEGLDLANVTTADIDLLAGAGLRMGSADLLGFQKIVSADAEGRKEMVARNVTYIKEAAAAGVKVFFACILPVEMAAPREKNYALALEAYHPIAEAAAAVGAKIAVEGYPGAPPNYAGLVCTPETVRTFLRELGPSVGLNYDPSHLIRIGVDHIRFLREFVGSVYHVHAKDTELRPEAIYEYGLYQGSVFAKPHGFGQMAWRYTLPGQGEARWPEIFSILKSAGYQGMVSIELEDERFNGSEEGEKAGLLHSQAYLRGV